MKQRLVLDAGSREGVHVGQAVIDAGGLMGQVISVTGGTSTVLLLTDPDHAVPVTVARNGVRLIVYGRGDTLELRDIPLSAGVEVGDEIVTSGLGGRFPAGFPVGTITGLRPDDTHAFLVGELKPAAQLDRGRDVLLLRLARRSACLRPANRSRLHLRRNRPAHLPLPRAVGALSADCTFGATGPRIFLTPAFGAPSTRGSSTRRVPGSAGRWPATDHAGGPAMSRLRDNPWVLPASLVVALLLGLLPLPALLQPLRPYWLALVLAYWVIEAPNASAWASPSPAAWWPTCCTAACWANRHCGW